MAQNIFNQLACLSLRLSLRNRVFVYYTAEVKL